MSDRDDRYEDVDTSHLDDVADGCGCTEMWEHTSEDRNAEDREAGDPEAEDPEVDEVAPEEGEPAQPSD